jgi:two-component system sensor histidine kinase TctE
MIEGTLSLRTRLLRRLLWPLLLLLLLGAAYDQWRATAHARDEQDHALQRVAIALASRLDVDADDLKDNDLGAHLQNTMLAMQRATSEDSLAFMVDDSQGGLLGGEMALGNVADPLAQSEPRFADRQFQGQPVRVITYPHLSPIGKVRVVIAETTNRRAEQAHRVLAETLLSNLLLMALALLLVRTGVNVAMRPLALLGRSVAARLPEDLSALPETRVPGELAPLVKAMNSLMMNLQAAAAQQQRFLSDAAHQLRTPLAGIQVQLELAAGSAEASQRPRLEGVQAALRRITHTTHQMLALARSGPLATKTDEFEQVDLRQLLEDAASEWLDAALAVQVDLGFDAQSAPVKGSPWMLRELLGNLISNALRHSPAGSRVNVSSGLDFSTGIAQLVVDDEGPGIPPSLREKVLQRFYQAPGAAKGGSGLGLSIVHEVTLRHGGTVDLQDAPSGRGLRVCVRFPTKD